MNILLTFDYELFFGKNVGTVGNCLIKPTDELLNLFQKIGASATFFVDTIFLKRLSEINEQKRNFREIVQQLTNIVKSGCRIEPHLHPHWGDAIYKEGTWLLPSYEHYTLHSLDITEVRNLLAWSLDFLTDIGRKVQKSYKCLAHRAGGFKISPFEELSKVFLDNHILVDSSVGSRIFIKHKTYSISYPNLPTPPYRFSTDPCKPDPLGAFMEVPISVASTGSALRGSIKRKFGLNQSTDGASQYGDGVGMSFEFSLWERLISLRRFASLDVGTEGSLEDALKGPNDTVVAVSHPKSLCKNSFTRIVAICNENTKFLNIKDILNFE